MRPSTPFELFPIAIGAGLNLTDAPGRRAPGEMRVLDNLVVAGGGRIEPKMAHRSIAAPAGDVVGVFRFPFYGSGASPIGAIGVLYAAGTATIHEISTAGAWGASVGSWTGLSARPVVRAAVIGQKLFLACVAGGARQALKYYRASDEAIIEPHFSFVINDPSGAAETYAAAFPRELASYNNFLFMAGFGTEDEADRPEIIRFSYLGLDPNDPDGAGDAGDPATAGSEGIFDTEDVIAISERGAPVDTMMPAKGRLVVLTPRSLHHLFGYSRDTFRAEQLSEHGNVSPNAAVLGGGTLYWWAPRVGPGFYTGGGFEEVGYKINPRLPEVDEVSLVGRHVPQAHQIRWYWDYNDGGTTVARTIAWNYQRQQWEAEGLLPFRVFCAGEVSTSSTDVGTGATSNPSGPAGAPSAPSETVTSTTSTVSWTNGDTSVGVQTEIFVEGALVATVDAGVSSYKIANLSPATAYSGTLRHKKNGQYSDTVAFSFTTAASSTTVAAPSGLSAQNSPSSSSAGAYLTWTPGQSGVKTQIERSGAGAGAWVLVATAAVDATSYWDGDVEQGLTYDYRVRAEHPSEPSNVSAYSATATVGPLSGSGSTPL